MTTNFSVVKLHGKRTKIRLGNFVGWGIINEFWPENSKLKWSGQFKDKRTKEVVPVSQLLHKLQKTKKTISRCWVNMLKISDYD